MVNRQLYGFRNTLKPVIANDNYLNSKSIEIWYDGSFRLLDSLIPGFKTLNVKNRDILPQSISTAAYDAGQDGSTVQYHHHTTRAIKVEYMVDLHNTTENDLFEKFNKYMSNGKIVFRFIDDPSWSYEGYLTSKDDLDGVNEIRTGAFTLTCYTPHKFFTDGISEKAMQSFNQKNSEGILDYQGTGASIFTNKDFKAPSDVKVIDIMGLDQGYTAFIDFLHSGTIKGDYFVSLENWQHYTLNRIRVNLPKIDDDSSLTTPLEKEMAGHLIILFPTAQQPFKAFLGDFLTERYVDQYRKPADMQNWTHIEGQYWYYVKHDVTSCVDPSSDIDDFQFFDNRNCINAYMVKEGSGTSELQTMENNRSLDVYYQEASL